MAGMGPADSLECLGGSVHEIGPIAAMDMDIEKTRGYETIPADDFTLPRSVDKVGAN
jgi:hypothetical protein